MAANATNPLSKHFRQPAIYLKLPSRGQFYPEGAIDLPETGEIPVYPMTVKDELTLKTPDALMNGVGMIEVVRSCCPNIRDPWTMPAIDVDAIFIAIRLASYGSGMDITSDCPHCKEENEHTIDLRVLLDNIRFADYTQSHLLDGLIFRFKPQKYKDINATNIITFEEQRLIDSIINNEQMTDAEKNMRFNESFKKLKDMNISVVVNSIDCIITEDGEEVSDQKFITEFLDKCSRATYDAIKQKITDMVEKNKLDPIELSCESCNEPYKNTLTFDQSNFFG